MTITKDGVPIGDIVPRGTQVGGPAFPFRTDSMGDLDLPDLGGPALSDEEIDETLRGMGLGSPLDG
ncbi:hypothetical protein [Streptomyces beihaiensis]|uniref:Type II toxin-antitoxin system prevent-host-death family antitoxin n=1 Tax=Streptomyces beihaiensis TaxID=2984495 RepID=A0ABT3U0G1_9ACTN|nr:hypothetical protein [Streptomyces beihaiensis]MCX3062191.1 hypothetical protein [Streptomyces beihaiensis]